MWESRESQAGRPVHGSETQGEMIYRLLCGTSGSVTAISGDFLVQNWLWVWADRIFIFIISRSFQYLQVELLWRAAAQCLHSGYWDSYPAQLRHFYSLSTVHTIKTHSRKWKSFVLQRYVQSFIANTLNCYKRIKVLKSRVSLFVVSVDFWKNCSGYPFSFN